MSDDTKVNKAPEHLDTALGRLGPAGAVPPPPAAYLRAVGRRRRQRTLARGTVVAIAVLALPAFVVLMSQTTTPQPGGQLIANETPKSPDAVSPPSAPVPASYYAILNLNPEFDTGRLVLPVSAPAGAGQPHLRLTTPWDHAELDRLLTQ